MFELRMWGNGLGRWLRVSSYATISEAMDAMPKYARAMPRASLSVGVRGV